MIWQDLKIIRGLYYVFEAMAQHNLILVTGPQRSGTTITARMIAADTGHDYIDELAFVATNKALFFDICRGAKQAVIQCPGMARFIHEVGIRDDVAVVFMLRDHEQIVASQERIGWSHERYEMSRYPAEWQRDTIAETKKAYWYGYQRRLCPQWLEVGYDDLNGHPLWLPAKKRRAFRSRQWRDG